MNLELSKCFLQVVCGRELTCLGCALLRAERNVCIPAALMLGGVEQVKDLWDSGERKALHQPLS